ncbi:hypothetical protein ACFQ10_37460 [Streptomyces indonesiensis]
MEKELQVVVRESRMDVGGQILASFLLIVVEAAHSFNRAAYSPNVMGMMLKKSCVANPLNGFAMSRKFATALRVICGFVATLRRAAPGALVERSTIPTTSALPPTFRVGIF